MKDNIYKEIEKKFEEYGVIPPSNGESFGNALEKILILINTIEKSLKSNVTKIKHKGWRHDE